jgi:hypothetical protein
LLLQCIHRHRRWLRVVGIEERLASMVECIERLDVRQCLPGRLLLKICRVDQLPVRLETQNRVNDDREADDCLKNNLKHAKIRNV